MIDRSIIKLIKLFSSIAVMLAVIAVLLWMVSSFNVTQSSGSTLVILLLLLVIFGVAAFLVHRKLKQME